MSNNRKSLRERLNAFSAQLPLMEGREKGDTAELLGQIITITDYGFLPNEAGEPYAVFITAERGDKFYFGGSVLTSRLSELEADGYHDEIVEYGIPTLLKEVKSRKTNRTYISVDFPEV